MSGQCDRCGEHAVDCDCPSTAINHPKHYQGKKFEVIDIIEDLDMIEHSRIEVNDAKN